MATYEAQCSAVGSFGYANYFKLYVVLTNRDGNSSTNQSVVDYNVYCQSSGSGSISARHLKYFNLNGQDIINTTESVNVSSPNAYIAIASGSMTVTHDPDGSKSISFSAKIQGATYGVSASISRTFQLTTIPRYSNLTSLSVKSRTVNSITFSFTSDKACRIFAKIESPVATSWLIGGGYFIDNKTSGEFTIYYADRASATKLSPNTTYKFTILCRNVDSGLDTSKEISATTYDIAKISSLTNFEHGSSPTVGITNPGSISSLSLVMKVGDTQILSRTVTAGNNAIAFSDTELDNLYKKYGSSNSLTATFVLSGSGYTNSKTCTITLKGNQKTIRTNVSSSWKRGKLWTNVNGTWKRGVLWTNVSGTWKRGI